MKLQMVLFETNIADEKIMHRAIFFNIFDKFNFEMSGPQALPPYVNIGRIYIWSKYIISIYVSFQFSLILI